MNWLKKLFQKPPCAKCPYTLGQVRTLVNPCPGCERDGYSMYEVFLRGCFGMLGTRETENK